MNPLRAALFCFFLAALVLFAQVACPDEIRLLAGAAATRGLGEQTAPAPAAALVWTGEHLALEGYAYSAHKLESGAGWGAHVATEWRLAQGHLGIGAAYSYRDGGAWSKNYPWARASVAAGPVRLIGEAALGGYNRERKIELRIGGRIGALALEPRWFVEQHLQGTGWGFAVLLGVVR